MADVKRMLESTMFYGAGSILIATFVLIGSLFYSAIDALV
jgi:hypothetical protein